MQSNQKFYIIYQTTNLINGKIYVGKHETYDLNDGYLGSGVLLKKAIDKYGKENFTRKILFECSSKEDLNLKEKEIVNETFVSRKDTYNVKIGGDGGFDYINKNDKYKNPNLPSIGGRAYAHKLKTSPEFKKKISDNLKKYWKEHPERREFIKYQFHSDWTGKHHTEETKKKLSRIKKLNYNADKNFMVDSVWVSNEELKISFPVPKSMLYDYITQGYIKKRVVDWNTYFDRKFLIEHHISKNHLSADERKLFNQHKVEDILKLRKNKKEQNLKRAQKRLSEVWEIAELKGMTINNMG